MASSTAWASRTIQVPTGGGTVAFDYGTDSESGYDLLRFLVNGTLQGNWSGPGKAGHASFPLPAGSQTLRFEYVKDSSVDAGLDSAWIDSIVLSDATGVLKRIRFDSKWDGLGSWSLGGNSGGLAIRRPGLARGLRRPGSQAYKGWQATPTTSSIERTITWASSGTLDFDYVVDSELNYDFLRVLVDGALVWSKSGTSSSRKSLSIAAGNHTVRFEYLKDTSVDVGLDLAAVDNVSASSAGVEFERHEFDGYALSTIPYGWVAGNSAWSAAGEPPKTIDVAYTTLASTPSLDGAIQYTVLASEYDRPTRIPLLDLKNPLGRTGTLLLRGDPTPQQMLLALRVHATDLAVGNESGKLTLFFDARRLDSVSGLSCGTAGHLPRSEDRKVVIDYTSAAGQAAPTLTVSQYVGTCVAGASAWTAAGGAQLLAVTATASEPAGDVGFLHFELRLGLSSPADQWCEPCSYGAFGLGIKREIAGGGGLETLVSDKGGVLVEDDTTNWLTVRIASPNIGRLVGRPETALLGFF